MGENNELILANRKTISMRMKTLTLFLVAVIFSTCTGYESQLCEYFKSPKLGNRPNLNIHSTPHDPLKQDSILDQYLLNGYGGIATNVNWVACFTPHSQMNLH